MEPSNQRRGIFAQLWHWLRHGHVARESAVLRRQRVWGAPIRVYRVFMDRRVVHPVPMLYVTVGVVGALVGLVLQRWLQIRWWIAPLALVFASWLWFFSSIWWRRGATPTSLSTELLMAIAPDTGARRHRTEEQRRLFSSPLPIFGVEGLNILPSLTSWSSDGAGIVNVQVEVAGVGMIEVFPADRDEDMVRAEVRSTLISLHANAIADAYARADTDARADISTTGSQTAEQFHRAFDEAMNETRELQWHDTTLIIDGAEFPGFIATTLGHTAATARSDEYWMTVVVPEHIKIPALRRLSDSDRVSAVTLR